MNKAFVREPDFDGRGYCPRCGSLGTSVGRAVLRTHVQPALLDRIGDAAWFCGFPRCNVAYFNILDAIVTVSDLMGPVYPKSDQASLCACFGFTMEEIEADAADDQPVRIRALLARSKSPEARCSELAADGQCCLREIQRLYMKLRNPS